MWKFIATSFIIWRVSLTIISWIGTFVLPQRLGFLGPSVWANFDGVYYLSIAQYGYMRFQEPFFPLYPLLIKFLAKSLFFGNFLISALFISHLSFFLVLAIFYKLVELESDTSKAKFAVLGLLIFPTSFFFAAVYTESLFLMLVLAAFYALKKDRRLAACILGGFAAATRLVGIFLLPVFLWALWTKRSKLEIRSAFYPIFVLLGFLAYVLYLSNYVGDPLAFIHSQPAFGAQRTGGEIVLLPQVYWRYLKIFTTVSFTYYDFWIAILEFLIFNFAIFSLGWGLKKGVNRGYLIFSFLSLVGPTLTGTLSSIPRYVLALPPIFIFYGSLKNPARTTFFILSFLLLSILVVLFTRGFFVA